MRETATRTPSLMVESAQHTATPRPELMRRAAAFLAAIVIAIFGVFANAGVASAAPSATITQGQAILTADRTSCTVGYVESTRAWTSSHCADNGEAIYNTEGAYLGILRWFTPEGPSGHDLAYIQFAAGTESGGNPITGDGIAAPPAAGTIVCINGRMSGNDCARAIEVHDRLPGMYHAMDMPKKPGDSGSGVYIPGQPGVVGIYQGISIVTWGSQRYIYSNYARMPIPTEIAQLPHQGFVPRKAGLPAPLSSHDPGMGGSLVLSSQVAALS